MKRKSLKLQTKITVFVIIIIFLSITLLAFLMVRWTENNIQKKAEINILNVAEIVANTPNIAAAIENKDSEHKIQKYVDSMLKSVNGIEMIVVADMQGIRYAHPNPEKIGQKFVGGDEARVLKNGETYISEATGTLGTSLRAFVPLFNDNKKQVGFVMVGELSRSIYGAKRQGIISVLISSLFSILLGIIGAFVLAKSIKRSLLGLEPEQMTQLYIEKKVMLESIREGIIAIDNKHRITLINDSAIEILKIRNKNIIGKDITKVFPENRLVQILETGVGEYDKEQNINGTIIMANRVPMMDGDKIVGALATFRDKTMVTRLAEEITGVKQIIEALRANTHEFMNKLHVILGLIQVGEPEEAKNFIIRVREEQQQILSTVLNKVKDPTIAGLLLGKLSRAKELGVMIAIDENTSLGKRKDHIKSDVLITVIGNLLENAVESVDRSNHEGKKVCIRIQEFDERIEIEIKDNGMGIKKEDQERIFNRGFTTKEGSRGVGLALVKEAVENLQGEIRVTSKYGKGTEIVAVLPKIIHSDNHVTL